MNSITNIVLVGDQGSTQSYIIQLNETESKTNFTYNTNSKYSNCGYVLPSTSDERWIQYGNDWEKTQVTGTPTTDPLQKSILRLYFPQYSADTFSPNTTYMLSAFTYIHGKKIELGSFETKRSDALACKPIRFGGMDEYYECIDFEIIDPFQLHYGDDETEIRSYFGEPLEVNDTGSILYVVLYVVENHDGVYIQKDGWTCGQNSIYLTQQKDFSVHMEYDFKKRELHLTPEFNTSYGNDLYTYINETYNCPENALIWEYVIMDKNDIYYQYSVNSYLITASYNQSYNDDFAIKSNYSMVTLPINECFNNSEDGVFKTMNDWMDGLYIIGSLSLVKQDEYDTGEYIPYVTVFSNKLLLTQSLFSAMLDHGQIETNKINIDDLDMNCNQISTINKIKETTNNIVVENSDAKNHIIQPVFYQTRELNNTIIHPAVTENISLNLETYKAQVKQFLVQIEGVSFKEIGRTSQGIVFKVYGNMLPKSVDDGILYVLDQDSNLVTTGKFTYVY